MLPAWDMSWNSDSLPVPELQGTPSHLVHKGRPDRSLHGTSILFHSLDTCGFGMTGSDRIIRLGHSARSCHPHSPEEHLVVTILGGTRDHLP